MSDKNVPVMTGPEIEAFITSVFPQATGFCRIVEVGEELVVRLVAGDDALRPGGTVSGPTLMTLADTAMYYLVLSRIGPIELAVTTNLNINFLRRSPPGAILARARMLKLGSRLAVGDVLIEPEEGSVGPIAHATLTYSIPPPEAR